MVVHVSGECVLAYYISAVKVPADPFAVNLGFQLRPSPYVSEE
jgi:hypothetical protein